MDWVCISLLKALQLEFNESEVISSPDEPPDVLFREARFEIKEIQDPGRRRHLEFKQALAKAEKATRASQLLEEFAPQNITPSQIAELVLAQLTVLSLKYDAATRRANDLLFYVNLNDRYMQHEAVPGPQPFSASGWRSVSVFENEAAIVLLASSEAPVFLSRHQGVIEPRYRS